MKKYIKQFLFGGPGAATALGDVGLAIFRLSVGLLMAAGHGWGKIWSADGFGPPDQMVTGLGEMGFPAPLFFAWCSALAEFLGGLLLALGLLTRPAALVLGFNMAIAAFVAHADDPWAGAPVSKEPALLYLAPCVMFLFTGGGRYAVDRIFRKRLAPPKTD